MYGYTSLVVSVMLTNAQPEIAITLYHRSDAGIVTGVGNGPRERRYMYHASLRKILDD